MKTRCIRSRCWCLQYPVGPPPSLPDNVYIITFVSMPEATHTTSFVRFRDPYTKSVFGGTLMEMNVSPVLWRDVLLRLTKLKPGVVIHKGDVFHIPRS